jgi:hypothetical protein
MKRFDPIVRFVQGGDAYGEMERDDKDGEWVRYSDAHAVEVERDALRAELDAVRAEIKRLTELVEYKE